MHRLLKVLWILFFATAVPAYSQTLPQDFADWAIRFESDMRVAESTSMGESSPFARSQWPSGSSTKYLSEVQAAGRLFPKPRNRRVWGLGESIKFLTRETVFAGSGGSVIGAELNSNLPPDSLEVIYVHPPTELGDRLESALKQQFGVRKIKMPPTGTFRRNEYPFLLFKRVDGKLYLAAFSKEFMAVVDAIFTLQIAGADHGELGVAVAAYVPGR
jgi:hypothetical protein